MATTGLINKEAFAEMMRKAMNEEMMKAAEPILEKALKDIERTMRNRLGGLIVGYIEHHMEVDRHGEALRILVRQEKI